MTICAYQLSSLLAFLSSSPPLLGQAGGMQVLAMHLGHRSNRLVLNILITLRNLSDTANRMDHLDELIRACISLLSSNDLQIVAYVLGILSNLTCNNAKNKVS